VISLVYRSRGLAHGIAAGALALTLIVPALRAESSLGFEVWTASLGRQIRFFYEDYWKEVLAGFVVLVFCLRDGWRVGTGPWRRRLSALPLMLSVLLAVVFIVQAVEDRRTVLAGVRNFYGTLKVRQYLEHDPAAHYYLLSHGETTHGVEPAHPSLSGRATSYYGPTSGVGRLLDLLPGTRRIGLVGLGAGTLAAYGRPGDTLRFYEINAAVEPLARKHFSYLRGAVADVAVVLGDARLVLEDELARGQPQAFDALVLDAFSSDAIPVHLLTREAMDVYLRHLRPGGVIAVHISNRFLDLQPVVDGLARHFGLHAVIIVDDPPADEWWLYRTTWVLLSRDPALFAEDAISHAMEAREEQPRTVDWTDDHASLFGILK
jgi:SAM-dependent methyltransferase